MVVYVAIGGLAVSALIATIGFTRPGSRIDWSTVPVHAVVPLWIADSLAGFAGFVVAAIRELTIAPVDREIVERSKAADEVLRLESIVGLRDVVLAGVIHDCRAHAVLAGEARAAQ